MSMGWDDYCAYILPVEVKEIPSLGRGSPDKIRKYHFEGGESFCADKGMWKRP